MIDSAVSVAERLPLRTIEPLTRNEDTDVRAVAAACLARGDTDLFEFREQE
jgi:hypothetical protein